MQGGPSVLMACLTTTVCPKNQHCLQISHDSHVAMSGDPAVDLEVVCFE